MLNNNHQLEQAEALMKDLLAASEKTREVTDQVMIWMMFKMVMLVRMRMIMIRMAKACRQGFKKSTWSFVRTENELNVQCVSQILP